MLDYSKLISYALSYLQSILYFCLLLLRPYISFIKAYCETLKTIRKNISDYTSLNNTSVQVHGTCSPGYEPVKELFIQNFINGLEDNAQICIYVNNACVVDLYGTGSGDTDYGPDNVQVIREKISDIIRFHRP